MSISGPTLPPEVRQLSSLYKIIPPDRFTELGIRDDDVPMGTFPAENHPPHLPDRFRGNAYGLGLYEQSELSESEAALLEKVDLTDPAQAAANFSQVNAVFKRLGLLIRYSALGKPFYLIPRQFVAHLLVEVQAKVDQIIEFLEALLRRRLTESLRVGLVTNESDLILPELQSRMPRATFTFIGSVAGLARRRGRRFDALVLMGDPRAFAAPEIPEPQGDAARRRQFADGLGAFVAGRLYDLLEEDGELLALAPRPVSSSRERISVEFLFEEDRKRFLLFSHVYRTRRRYTAAEGPEMEINLFDYNSFLTGLGMYHETVEKLLGGRTVDKVGIQEIDRLEHRDISMPRGSTPQLLGSWRRWFGPFFDQKKLTTALAEMQRRRWLERYRVQGDLPDNLVVYIGHRRRPKVTLAGLEGSLRRQYLAGCARELLAPYKDSFQYVLKVLQVLNQIKKGSYTGIPGPELARLREPFETAVKHQQLKDVSELMSLAPRLARLREALNPDGFLGAHTSVLGNIDKLSLLGLDENLLVQLYLIVLGHSPISRVTFGKLSETTLKPLSEISRYDSLDEAVAVLRLYRLMSVAETAAASSRPLRSQQLAEFFHLVDRAVQIASQPALTWERIMDAEVSRLGGVRAKATRKMLKLLDLYGYLDSWQDIAAAGEYEREARSNFQPRRMAEVRRVVALVEQVGRFVGHYYAGDTSARPYFFRALLNSELHGTGRLLAPLGSRASFTLLWICVHVSERRLINFNPLLQVEHEGDLSRRLAKLRQALLSLSPQGLSPGWLLRLREAVEAKGEAYVRDSGLHLKADPVTGALTARFVDPEEELQRLEEEIEQSVNLDLDQISSSVLTSMDNRAFVVGRFLAAWRKTRGLSVASLTQRQKLESHLGRLEHRLEGYLLDQLSRPERFAPNLWRMARYSFNRLNRWLPHPVDSPQTQSRLAAASKLGALFERRLDYFQDLQLSHEKAMAEFGPNTTGIVGVSQPQFAHLAKLMASLKDSADDLPWLLILAVLIYQQTAPDADDPVIPERLRLRLRITEGQARHLEFLLRHHYAFAQIINGEACLLRLEPIVQRGDPQLIEAVFLLGLVITAASREGLVTEDYLERLFGLMAMVRGLRAEEASAEQAHQAEIAEQAQQALAFHRYRTAQAEGGFTVSLRRMLETTRLPEDPLERERWLKEGRLQSGIGRLLGLRGLPFVSALDLLMMRRGVPVAQIYRLKNLRSMGVTHFERDLYEGLRLYRGLQKLPRGQREFVLGLLSDSNWPLRLTGFARAAERLTYTNQIRLLLLGLAGARRAREGGSPLRVVSFQPLAQAAESRFEMVNEAISLLDPEAIGHKAEGVQGFFQAEEGLYLTLERSGRVLSVSIRDPRRLERKMMTLRQAEDPLKLKHIYHRELKRLKLTAYDTLDYQQRLATAFSDRIARLGQAMVEKVRREMSREEDLANLEALFHQAREEGLALPLSQDLQQTLGDLYEMNLDRLRQVVLSGVLSRLAEAASAVEVDRLWEEAKAELLKQRRFYDGAFLQNLARHFDRRAEELRSPGG